MFTKPELGNPGSFPPQFGRLVDIVEGPARRNFIRNGDFQIVQRGTSFVGVVAQAYQLDGWLGGNGASTTSITQETFAIGQTEVPNNPRKYISIARTVASAISNVVLEHRIEFPARLSGKTVTVSFYAKVAAGAKVLAFDFLSAGVTPAIDTADNAFTATTAWAPFSATITVPAMTAETANAYLGLLIRETSGFSTFTLSIADVQVEEGSEATRFERLDYDEQLRWARRFLPAYVGGGSLSTFAHGLARSTTQAYIPLSFPVQPRVVPTGIAVSNGAHFSLGDGVAVVATTTVAFAAASPFAGTLDVGVAAGLTQFRPYLFVFNNAAASILFTGAEL